jgi:hypothetical protein
LQSVIRLWQRILLAFACVDGERLRSGI